MWVTGFGSQNSDDGFMEFDFGIGILKFGLEDLDLDFRTCGKRCGFQNMYLAFWIWIPVSLFIAVVSWFIAQTSIREPCQMMRKQRAAFWMFTGKLLSAFEPSCMDLYWPPSSTQNGQILKSKTNAPCPCKPFFLNTIFFFRKKLLGWGW